MALTWPRAPGLLHSLRAALTDAGAWREAYHVAEAPLLLAALPTLVAAQPLLHDQVGQDTQPVISLLNISSLPTLMERPATAARPEGLHPARPLSLIAPSRQFCNFG